MAEMGELKAGAVALQRFGLGPKPGQGEAARAQIREKLLAEIAAGSVAQPQGVAFSGAAEIGKALYEFEDQEKREREARRIVAVAPAPEMQQGPPMASAAPQAPPAGPQNQMAAPSKPPNEPALPYRTYRDEVKARVDLALAAETGFGERLVMFWSNHFCIGATKSNMSRIMAGAYEARGDPPACLRALRGHADRR